MVVDYAQRVPPELAALAREQHIDYVVRSLKVLALRRGVAAEAVDEQAIRRQGPVHLEDLWGPVAITYEPDVGLVLNNEHLEPICENGRARAVRLGIGKNLHGPSEVEWRHHLYGERFYIQLEGSLVPAEENSQMEPMGGRVGGVSDGRKDLSLAGDRSLTLAFPGGLSARS